jgi:cell wall assembly regulator SMI1
MKPLEIIQRARGAKYVDNDGRPKTLELLPPLSAQELASLQAMLPCPLPADVRDLFAFSRGFSDSPSPLEGVDCSGLALADSFGNEEVFPCPIPIAGDGFGNFWVVDLTSRSTSWGPIFFACHDPPVIVFQTDGLAHFIEEVLRLCDSPQTSGITRVSDEAAMKIWRENPGVLSREAAVHSADPELNSFAESLDETFVLVDLRKARCGDGFSWGRYGPRSIVRRHGETLLFAYQKKSLLSRLFGR